MDSKITTRIFPLFRRDFRYSFSSDETFVQHLQNISILIRLHSFSYNLLKLLFCCNDTTDSPLLLKYILLLLFIIIIVYFSHQFGIPFFLLIWLIIEVNFSYHIICILEISKECLQHSLLNLYTSIQKEKMYMNMLEDFVNCCNLLEFCVDLYLYLEINSDIYYSINVLFSAVSMETQILTRVVHSHKNNRVMLNLFKQTIVNFSNTYCI